MGENKRQEKHQLRHDNRMTRDALSCPLSDASETTVDIARLQTS